MKKFIYPVVLFVAIFLSITSNVFGQVAGQQVPITINGIAGSGSPNTYLYLPWDYNVSGKTYPLIIFCAGLGEAGSGGARLPIMLEQGLPYVINEGHPPYSVNKSTGDTTWFIVSSLQAPYGWTNTSMVLAELKALENTFHLRIDTNRVYITGLSAGGAATIGAMTDPVDNTLFAAAVAMSPASYVSSNNVNYFSNRYIWFFQGMYDNVVGTGNATGSNSVINGAYPGHSRLTMYPSGHGDWIQFYEPSWHEDSTGGQSIYDFLLSHTLNTEGLGTHQPPIANAGSNQTITLPVDSVLLDGSASSDPDGTIVSYTWTKQSGPAAYTIASPASAKTKVTGLDTGTYIFTLTVKDDSGATSSANVTVTVKDSVVTTPPPHQPPVANAGANQTITLPVDSVLLDGSTSSDPDGTIVSYTWTKLSGPSSYTIASPASVKTKVTGLDTGTYIFTLTVKDDSGATSSSNVTVTVKDSVVTTPPALQPPIANAGANQTITLPVDSVLLDGTASSDSDGTIVSYTWTKLSGPSAYTIANPASTKTKVTGLDTGTYIFTLTVKDNSGATSSANVTITVKDSAVTTPSPHQPPVANAGTNQTITLPVDSLLLDGSASSDSNGTIVSYTWTKQSGPAVYVIANPDSVKTKVTGLDAGTYIFTLTVKDDSGLTSSANVTVTVNEAKVLGTVAHPVADAGDDTTITLPVNSVYLNGSRTQEENDTGGFIFYSWEKVSGPQQGDIPYPYKPVVKAENLVVGVYTFKLTVHINSGPTASDTVRVTVLPDPVQPGDVPFTANSLVTPYNGIFQYGTNPGSFNGWDDTGVASLALRAGIHSIRFPLPEYFIERYDYTIRSEAMSYYQHQLGMKELTLFVGEPGPIAQDTTVFYPNTQSSKVFKNLYTPIWDNGENGTPVNDSNYFAVYIYNLVKRYGNEIRFWEIVNEPDATGFWDNGNKLRSDSWWNAPPQPEALINIKAPVFYYIRMLRIAYEVIKKVYPQDYIAPGGIGYPAFLDALLRYTDNPDSGKVTPQYPLTGGAYFDAVSFHDYPAYSLRYWANGGFHYDRYSDAAVEAVIDAKNSYEGVLASRGYDGSKYPAKLFILTETNLPREAFNTGPDFQYYGSDEIQRNYGMKVFIDAQKAGIRQLYTYGISESESLSTATDPYQLMGLYQNISNLTPGQVQFTDQGKGVKTTSMLLYGWQYDSVRTKALNLPDSIDGAAFKKDTQYRYVLWAKTHIDMSEAASANYSFPASLHIDSLHSYQWNYSVDTTAQGKVSSQNVALTGTPIFFMATPFVDSTDVPPVADAGKNQTIMLPKDSVTLDGSGSLSPDGTIVSYQWVQTTGPGTAVVDTANPVHPIITGLIAGVYTFKLTVTDNRGATDADSVTVTVNNKVNLYPIPNAGVNQVITLPVNLVNLDGSASMDPDGTIVKYQWAEQSGPSSYTFSNANGVATTASNLVPGTYIFSLTVTDNDGASASSNVTIFVNAKANQPPVANAGSNITIQLPADSVMLNGSQSTDPDGTIAGYQWSQQSGPAGAIFGQPSGASVPVTHLAAGTYVFNLTVTDNQGATGTSTVTVVVKPANNIPPVANAGINQTITLPVDSAQLNGSASYDPDGKIVSWKWSNISGPGSAVIRNPASAKTMVSGLVAGTYVFNLAVTDDSGAQSSAQVSVTVNAAIQPPPPVNQPPVASVGSNQTITLPVDSAVIDGSASYDPDGKIVKWKWQLQTGPASYQIRDTGSPKTVVAGLTTGTYIFTLTVTDNGGASSFANVTITVNPIDTTGGTSPVTPPAHQPPVANAGQNQTITLPVDSVTLDGSGSHDPDGKIVSWKWTKEFGPATYYIGDTNSSKTTASGLTAGTYIFTLTVTDDSGATASANVTITVNPKDTTGGTPPVTPPANQLPVANAGNNQTITLPVDSAMLDGSASSDSGGKIISWNWSTLSGPGNAVFTHADSAKTIVSGLVAGTYVFNLKVTDNSGASSSAQVSVVVNSNDSTPPPVTPPPPAHTPPVANAGNNITITLPVNFTPLNGTGSHGTNGSNITMWMWQQQSGPGTATFSNVDSSKTTVSGLVAGTYVFTLTVMDNNGATAAANVTIRVNQPPVANAGTNTNIFLPVDSTLLNGSASYDPDGHIVSWSWSQQSGPATANILTPDSAKTEVNNLVNGIYVFTLIVTDNDGAKDTSNVTIGVYQKPAQPPVANAGQDITIVLPQNSVTLDGSASYDPDGTIATYHWDPMTGPSQAKLLSPDAPTTIVSGLQMGTYDFKLTVTDNNGQSATATVSVYVMPARDTTPTTFRIYPNPVHDMLHVELDKAITGLLEFRIIDVNGRIIKVYRFGQLPTHVTKVLDVSGLAPGIYFIQLIEDNQLRDVRKMIKY